MFLFNLIELFQDLDLIYVLFFFNTYISYFYAGLVQVIVSQFWFLVWGVFNLGSVMIFWVSIGGDYVSEAFDAYYEVYVAISDHNTIVGEVSWLRYLQVVMCTLEQRYYEQTPAAMEDFFRMYLFVLQTGVAFTSTACIIPMRFFMLLVNEILQVIIVWDTPNMLILFNKYITLQKWLDIFTWSCKESFNYLINNFEMLSYEFWHNFVNLLAGEKERSIRYLIFKNGNKTQLFALSYSNLMNLPQVFFHWPVFFLEGGLKDNNHSLNNLLINQNDLKVNPLSYCWGAMSLTNFFMIFTPMLSWLYSMKIYIVWRYMCLLNFVFGWILLEGAKYIKNRLSILIVLRVMTVCLMLFLGGNVFGLVPFGRSVTINFFALALMIWFILGAILVLNILYTSTFSMMSLFFPKGSPSVLAFMVVALEMMSYIIWAMAMPIWMFANSFAGHVLLSLGIIMGITPNPNLVEIMTLEDSSWFLLDCNFLKNLSLVYFKEYEFYLMSDMVHFFYYIKPENKLIHLDILMWNSSDICWNLWNIMIVYYFNQMSLTLKFLVMSFGIPVMMLTLEMTVSFIQSYMGFVLILLYMWDHESLSSVWWMVKYQKFNLIKIMWSPNLLFMPSK